MMATSYQTETLCNATVTRRVWFQPRNEMVLNIFQEALAHREVSFGWRFSGITHESEQTASPNYFTDYSPAVWRGRAKKTLQKNRRYHE